MYENVYRIDKLQLMPFTQPSEIKEKTPQSLSWHDSFIPKAKTLNLAKVLSW